jgi:hypothetical protein
MYRRGEEITGDFRLRRQVSKWMDYAPRPPPVVSCNRDLEAGIPCPLEMGLCLNSADAKKLRVRAGGNVFYLEPLPCAYSVVKLSLERKTVPAAAFFSSVFRILEEMKRRDLRPAGAVYGRTVVSLYKDLNPKLDSYQEYWIPYILPHE